MNQEPQPASRRRWPLPLRIGATILLSAYLLVMAWAPLSTPVGAPHLTTPVENKLAPIQNALFLHHGYRFFGPNPGPTHALVYEITGIDGSIQTGHFPDRETTTPRLLYHRWFMLSETLYREASQLPTDEDLQRQQRRYQTQFAAFEQAGKTELSQRLKAERSVEVVELQHAKKRWESLLMATARALLKRESANGNSATAPATIRLWIQSRGQPTAEEALSGMQLTDPALTARFEVGFFTADTLLETQVTDPTADRAEGPLPESGQDGPA